MCGLRRILPVVIVSTLWFCTGCESDFEAIYEQLGIEVEKRGDKVWFKFVSTRETDIKLRRMDFQLGGLPVKVDALIFTESDVTDRGLGNCTKLTELEALHFNQCPRVSNRGFKKLLHNRQLRELSVVGTRVNDDGMALFSDFSDLRKLSVGGIGDRGLAHISKLSYLQQLTLVDCRINEPGANSIARLRRLRTLELYRCEMQGSTRVELKRLLPGTRIVESQL